MKKYMTILLSALLLILCVRFPAQAQGTAYTQGPYQYHITDGAATISEYFGSEESMTIPAAIGQYPVAKIESGAFDGNTAVKTVTLPDTITEIETGAFRGSSVTTVNITGEDCVLPEDLLSGEISVIVLSSNASATPSTESGAVDEKTESGQNPGNVTGSENQAQAAGSDGSVGTDSTQNGTTPNGNPGTDTADGNSANVTQLEEVTVPSKDDTEKDDAAKDDAAKDNAAKDDASAADADTQTQDAAADDSTDSQKTASSAGQKSSGKASLFPAAAGGICLLLLAAGFAWYWYCRNHKK